MSKLEITTNSDGVARIRDIRTGKSEIVQLPKNSTKAKYQVECDSSGVAAHILYRDTPAKAA